MYVHSYNRSYRIQSFLCQTEPVPDPDALRKPGYNIGKCSHGCSIDICVCGDLDPYSYGCDIVMGT